jgi:hypothetical protein
MVWLGIVGHVSLWNFTGNLIAGVVCLFLAGDQAFAEAFAAGQQLSLDEAFATILTPPPF